MFSFSSFPTTFSFAEKEAELDDDEENNVLVVVVVRGVVATLFEEEEDDDDEVVAEAQHVVVVVIRDARTSRAFLSVVLISFLCRRRRSLLMVL